MKTKSNRAPDFPPNVQAEYEASLKRIQELSANPAVMGSISERMENRGEPDEDAVYMDNIEKTLRAWKEYPDSTWSV